ncbi:GNAT family N-acetyltransferase [Roseovarius sp. Pro17]|uniref:GNAT family N-acetyltransferase n=1 Tax=Roseovarius sp. Pro17 TaxID=3108175 RepID=UPI002D789098|nr:GNAT family N-acyltransferase [Roseovarius sp. Pro17]
MKQDQSPNYPIDPRRYIVRAAEGPDDLIAAQRLRAAAFGLDMPDGDAFDSVCTHMLIEDRRLDSLAGCFRLLPLDSGAGIVGSYAAQFYDLSALAAYPEPMTELGRFCIHPAARDPEILRAAWGAIAAHVDGCGVGMLFGCTSFRGTDPTPYRAAFAALARTHLAPRAWAPRPRAATTVPLAGATAPDDAGRAIADVPPLLRSYLRMGGWVSDHAVVDSAMDTLHVFTGLEIASIPEARKQQLRATLDGGAGAG